jgi:hypothetical protein
MQPNIEQLKTTYKNLNDDKLTHLAITQAASLRPEALEILKAEIKSRGLDEGIMNGVNVQLADPGSLAIDDYIELVRSQACPVCSSTAAPLNAIVIGSVKSFIILTQYKKKLMVACPSCLQQANQKATSTTAIMGWWGLPWGIIRTSQALFRNIKANKAIRANEPSDSLISFIKTNAGVIESVRKNNQALQAMLDSVNKR